MAIVKSEFILALNQVATERGISPDEVIESIESAIIAAYKKEYPEEDLENVSCRVNRSTGETRIYRGEKDITPPGFGRIAAQTAKQVFFQKNREAEKKTVVSQFQTQIGALMRGRVIRFDGHNAYLDINKAEAVMPREEQINGEQYAVNDSFVVYLKDIAQDKFGNPRIIVSRSDPRLIKKLFEREVPEIANNTVEIKKVVRHPGERAKIAVFSAQGGVDPVGACVGQKGVRVQTVTDELGGGEKIDIIQWNPDVKTFLIAALAPAKINAIVIDEKAKAATVTVEESQAPLAIGRGGVNVNLAADLSGLSVKIEQIKDSVPPENTANATPLPVEEKVETNDQESA